jgi:hypothetical protein
MKRALSILAVSAAAAALVAPSAAPAQAGPERIKRIIVYGRDACPKGADGDIVVCARRSEGERYRIPEALRDGAADDDPENSSWAARAQSLEYVGRTGIQSCSTVGGGGFTGCWAEMMRAARGDRRTSGEPGR